MHFFPKMKSITETELTEIVKTYFADNLYKGFSKPFELTRLELSGINYTIVHAVPTGIDEELDRVDSEWETGLAKLGAEFGVHIKLPYWCYSK